MAATQLYSEPLQGFDALLKEGARAKDHAAEITEKYAKGPSSPLDGTIHPSLRASGPLVPWDPSRKDAVVRRQGQEEHQGTDLVRSKLDTKVEEDGFKAAMKEYEKTAKDKYKTGIDPDLEHTMEQLWAVVDEAVDKYKNKDIKGTWGKIRLAFRKLGENDQPVQSWLGLLPTQSQYLSVVCGGLKLIIKAAARMKSVADKIMEALHEIPVILSGAQRVLSIYKNPGALEVQSNALYGSVLTALGHMLEYLGRKSHRKVFKVGFKQESFEEKLLEKISDLTKKRNAFNAEAEICEKEMLDKIADVTKTTNKNSEDTLKEVRRIQELLVFVHMEQRRARKEIAESLEVLMMSGTELKRRQSEIREEVSNFKQALAPLDGLMELLRGNPKALDLAYSMQKSLDAPETASELSFRRRSTVSTFVRSYKTAAPPSQQRRNLLSRLDYDPDVAGADVVTNYTLAARLSREDQERGLYVIKSGTFASWVTAERSAALVIHGNAGRVQRSSALSFVCARLVYALDQIRAQRRSFATSRTNILTLHFFCGQHTTSDHSWETPSGVLNSLLAQLLTQCKDVDLTKATNLGSFDSKDLKAAIKRFAYVLAQFPPRTIVFCVIDALSFYVDDDRVSRDAGRLIKSLVELARGKSRKRSVFKLLLTAPNRLRASEIESLSNDEVVNVPKSLPNTGGFTTMKWDLGIGRQLEELTESDE